MSGGSPPASAGAYTTLGVLEARDVSALVDYVELHEGVDAPVLLYGVSMGAAAITRALAVEAVEADALILDAPFDRMLGTVRNRFESMGVPASPAAELLVFWGGQAFDFDGFAHDPVDYAAAITVPTLIVHGLDDPPGATRRCRASARKSSGGWGGGWSGEELGSRSGRGR